MLNRWVEVGNSGMFRPEMLQPMGFPKDVRILGFGLSLERPTMIRFVNRLALPFLLFIVNHRYGINNIRTLVGHKVPIESIENAAAVLF